jgi:hypothetical protein
MQRQTGSFVAHDDQGRPHTIHVYADFIRTVAFNEPAQELQGPGDLRLASGGLVNRLKQGEYQVLDTGVILTSTSPDAP